MGDGYLKDGNKSKKSRFKDYLIKIELIDKDYLTLLLNYVKTIIKTKSRIRTIIDKRPNRKKRYSLCIKNKWLHNFLVKELKIPSGKKSGEAFIPKEILKNKEYLRYFIGGLFDTDGGKRGHTIGFTSKSRLLIDQLSKELTKLEISHLKESWKNKKYNRYYHGIRLHKKSIDTFLNTFPLQNINKRGSARVWKMGMAQNHLA